MRVTRVVAISLALAAATITVYAQAVGFDFVRYDDGAYVTKNPYVLAGLTVEGVRWALTAGHAGNWHPLTWLSHMLDCQLYGLHAGGHHLTSVLLHTANTVLLFALFCSMTGAVWRSVLVAALFGVHPLHVESVAWVAERKDVLSATLGFLSTGAYVAYARRGGVGRYLLSAVLLGLGLMAKPMLVTLPFVFLLLDYWPLDRMARAKRSLPQLLVEKVPLLALSAAVSAATVAFQQGAGAIVSLPLHLRLANALVSYVRYIGKMLWPVHLAVMYPHPNMGGGTPWDAWQVIGAALLLLGMSVVFLRATEHRYLAVGWLWYLGTLVPVIGLVQVGQQGLADRYTYIPLIGLFIIIAWGAADLARWRRALEAAVTGLALALLAGAMACSWSQARHWRDSISLFRHGLTVTPESPVLNYNFGLQLQAEGDFDGAIAAYRRALRAWPTHPETNYNLGIALQSRQQLDEAINSYRRALDADPDLVPARINLGTILQYQGKLEEAIQQYRHVLEIDPELAVAHNVLGTALQSQGKLDEAIHHFQEAVRIAPDSAAARKNLDAALQARAEPRR